MNNIIQQVDNKNVNKCLVVDTYELVMGLGENRQLKLTVLDTAGQEDFKHIRTIATRGADVCILCYSVDNVNSLDNAKSTWVPEIKEQDVSKCFSSSLNLFSTSIRGSWKQVGYV